jgi:hypothetical protein
VGGNGKTEVSCAAIFQILINKMHDNQLLVDIRNSLQRKFCLISLHPLAYAPFCFTRVNEEPLHIWAKITEQLLLVHLARLSGL